MLFKFIKRIKLIFIHLFANIPHNQRVFLQAFKTAIIAYWSHSHKGTIILNRMKLTIFYTTKLGILDQHMTILQYKL